MKNTFPFSAIVGMKSIKRSLLFHAIDPQLGGVLLMGHRGCAKSTIARAFADILAVENKVPFIEVPLGTTEDRLLGSIDTSRLLEQGKWSVKAGLLESANQGILYIDEINLLADHLMDSLLDSATSGRHKMERDGISAEVDARYLLIGSMNPEEGELRPQMIDRFAHRICISDDFTPQERKEIVRRRMEFDDDAPSFVQRFQLEGEQLKSKILNARTQLHAIQISETIRDLVAEKAKGLQLEGVRTEIAVLKTARCIAVWEGTAQIETHHLEEAWSLCYLEQATSALPPPPQNSSPPSPQTYYESLHKPQSPQTAPTPTDAKQEAIPLDSLHPSTNNALTRWSRHQVRFSSTSTFPLKQVAHASLTMRETRCISWSQSVLQSLKQGWKPQQKGWQFQYQMTSQRPQTWIFIDGSRSTGSTRFLAKVRDALALLSHHGKFRKYSLLFLVENQVIWLAKKATSSQFLQSLYRIQQATGKSYLTFGLYQFKRSLLNRGFSAKDRLIMATDGLMSPQIGENAREAKVKFQHKLAELDRLQIPSLWLHPQGKQGMKQWVNQLADGLSFHLMEM